MENILDELAFYLLKNHERPILPLFLVVRFQDFESKDSKVLLTQLNQ